MVDAEDVSTFAVRAMLQVRAKTEGLLRLNEEQKY